jgi:chromosome segregation ATPase
MYLLRRIFAYSERIESTSTILRANLNEHYRSKQHQNVLMSIVLHLKSVTIKTDSRHTIENATIQLQEIDQTRNILSDGVAILKEDEQRLSTEVIHHQQALDILMKNLSKLKISIQEQNAFLDEIKRYQDIIPQELETVKEKINDVKTRSCDGTLLWKITDVQEKRGKYFMFY